MLQPKYFSHLCPQCTQLAVQINVTHCPGLSTYQIRVSTCAWVILGHSLKTYFPNYYNIIAFHLNIIVLHFVTGIRQLSLISNHQLFLCDSADEIRPISDRCNIRADCEDFSDERNCENCKKRNIPLEANRILTKRINERKS